MPFQFLDHEADIKIQLTGNTEQQLFEQAISALAAYSTDKKIEPKKGKTLEVKGTDRQSLLYNFIEELLYLIDAEQFIACKGTVTLRGNNLTAELYGDDTKNYALLHVKSPTYAEMQIEKKKTGWEAIIVLDV